MTATILPLGPFSMAAMDEREARLACRRASVASEMFDPSCTTKEMESIIPRPPLSPARGELARAIALVGEAQRECATAAEPAHRLHEVVAKLERAENELTELRAEDERLLGEWLAAGAADPRPQPSPATLEAERKLAVLVRDGAAARTARPQAETAHRTAVERLTALGEQRQDAGYRAAVEAAEDFLRGPFTTALVAFLRCENRVRSVESALRTAGHGRDPSSTALGCSVGLGEMIAATRRACGVEHDTATGPALLDRLMVDPEASLK
jgi:hypothetical protein